MKAFMANVGKKVNLFSMLSFCFAKSDLRVWEDIWEKSSRKMNDIVKKTWNLFVFKSFEKRNHSVTKFFCASKPFQRDIAGKRFKVLIINVCGKKVHECVGISKTSICNRFSNWCQKLRKMMDVVASRKYSIFVPELVECLNWLFQLIWFLVTTSILGFQRMRPQNLT